MRPVEREEIEALRAQLSPHLSFDTFFKIYRLWRKARVARITSKWRCAECRQLSWDLYMVTDEVWRQVMPSRHGILHMQCLVKRLGRKLKHEDFKPVPCNDWFLHVVPTLIEQE